MKVRKYKEGVYIRTQLLGQQVLRAGIVDVLGIANIANIIDVADIGIDITDINIDIIDIIIETGRCI